MTEEPCECESLKHGSGLAAGEVIPPPTITILEAYWAIEGKSYDLADEGLVVEFEFTDVTTDGEPVIDIQIGRRVWREKGGYEIEAIDTAIGLESFAEALQKMAEIAEGVA